MGVGGSAIDLRRSGKAARMKACFCCSLNKAGAGLCRGLCAGVAEEAHSNDPSSRTCLVCAHASTRATLLRYTDRSEQHTLEVRFAAASEHLELNSECFGRDRSGAQVTRTSCKTELRGDTIRACRSKCMALERSQGQELPCGTPDCSLCCDSLLPPVCALCWIFVCCTADSAPRYLPPALERGQP